MILYYITDRKAFPGSEAERQGQLLAKLAEAARAGVDYLQLREKDLGTRDLEALAHKAVALVQAARQQGSRTRLLVNSRSDIALACGADGVHLTASDVSAGEVRALWISVRTEAPVIAVSCHSPSEVRMAESQGADFAVLAPIFGKQETGAPGIGLKPLAEACKRDFPVLALGGVTLKNAALCGKAGAAGVAGIRLLQDDAMTAVVAKLRASP